MLPIHQQRHQHQFELETIISVFLSALSDIIVTRFNAKREPQHSIKVRLVYAPKQRVLLDILDKDQKIQLPVIAVTIGGIQRDSQRVFNKMSGQVQLPSTSSSNGLKIAAPQPLDIVFNVTIVTRYQSDMDQILAHILPYVNPYFIISWRTPFRPEQEMRSPVFWNGSVNLTYPYDIAANVAAQVVAELSFTFKAWFFQAPHPENDRVALIHRVETIYHSIPSQYLLPDVVQKGIFEREEFLIQGTPPAIRFVAPSIMPVGRYQQFAVWGEGFKGLQNVYLSTNNENAFFEHIQLCKPFANNPELSAIFPPFYGIKIPQTWWQTDQAHYVTFWAPSASEPCHFDIIFENFGGYAAMTQTVRRETFNPFSPTDPRFSTHLPYQFPFIDGIKVI